MHILTCMKTTASKIEAVVVSVVAKLYKANDGRRLGIREVALAVEEAMGQETDIADIHRAVAKTCAFYPSDDPQCKDAPRQRSFGWQPDWTTDPQCMRLWVLPAN